MKGYPLVFVASLLIWGCTEKKSLNRFSDPILVSIADAQDRRLSDSLYRYFKSPTAQYRAAAALAFGSVRDSLASPGLGNLLLEDPDILVRTNAAFSLGQVGCIASVNALIPALTDHEPAVVREVLEALGKAIRKNDIDVVKGYVPIDSVTREGLAWSFYRLGVRGLADSAVINRQAEFLNARYSYKTRLAAANFFNRALISGNSFEKKLIASAVKDPSADVRMAATSGLRKLKTDPAWSTLKTILQVEKDYRVKVNAARAMFAISLDKIKPLLHELLNNQNPEVGIAASEALANLLKEPWQEVLVEARHATNWRTQATLYKAFLTVSSSKEVVEEIKSKYKNSPNAYQKAWLLGALSKSPDAFLFIRNELLTSKIPVVQSSAAEAMVTMDRDRKLSKARGPEFVETYQLAIAGGDPAVIGIICQALSDPDLGYKALIKNFDFLRAARTKLNMPRDIESIVPLDVAIAYVEGRPKPKPPKNAFNHPIDWKAVASIPSTQRVLVMTTKGEIVMRLLVEEAPGSVVNFLSLASKKYFDGKYFHRVVPNFVIQTGCNRGDGFGSEDYSIRSEFATRHYTTGSVGMASAGNDTEGTQWFITHSPTPHLDGNYTIFAEVEKGMDVVHRIEVGDQIVSVSLINN